MDEKAVKLIETIREAIIGDDRAVEGPFGVRRVTYADYTASGRSSAVHRGFHPRRSHADVCEHPHRDIDNRACRRRGFAKTPARRFSRRSRAATEDVVIFCGSGATGAINKLIEILNLRLPADLDARYDLAGKNPAGRPSGRFHRPLRTPFQRDLLARDDCRCGGDRRRPRRTDRRGTPRTRAREPTADRPLKIGSFSAASNVTGIVSNTEKLSVLLHRHGALAFWDFAAAAPYVSMEMNPPPTGGDPLASKDAIFISPHKFVGWARHSRCAGGQTGVGHQPCADRSGRRHGHLCECGRPQLYQRPRHPRGGRDSGDHRVDSLGVRVQAQGGCRRRGHRREGRVLCDAGDRRLVRQSPHRHSRQQRGEAPFDRFLSDPPARPLSAPQLRGCAAQRSLRYPGAGRVLLCRARMDTACWASTWPIRRGSRMRSTAAAKASNRAGFG